MNYIFMRRIGLAYLLALGAQVLAVPHIQQIHVTQQVGSSCGYHATINATAVDTLAWQGGQLTSAAIIQEARQYRHLIQRNAILGDTIIDLANQLDIANLYCVNGRNGLAFAGASQDSQDGNQFLNDVVTQRQHAHPMIGHFVVNTGGHWVTFSVVKQPGQEVTIVYMDSVNTPLSRNRVAQAIGNTILARLGGAVGHANVSGARGSARVSGRTERNFGKAKRTPSGRLGRNSGERRRPDVNVRQPEYVQESDYASEYNERHVPIKKTPKTDTEFSYKTYIAVGLVCLLIGLNLK